MAKVIHLRFISEDYYEVAVRVPDDFEENADDKALRKLIEDRRLDTPDHLDTERGGITIAHAHVADDARACRLLNCGAYYREHPEHADVDTTESREKYKCPECSGTDIKFSEEPGSYSWGYCQNEKCGHEAEGKRFVVQ